MAASWIKSAADYKVWLRAIERAKKKVGEMNHPLKWRYAHGIFNKMIASHNSALNEDDDYTLDTTEDAHYMINSFGENKLYEWAVNYVTTHPVYEQLTEEELFEEIETIYTGYKIHQKDNYDQEKLLEFSNRYMNRNLGGAIGGPAGLGGYRDEKPKGPYVYGVPGYGVDQNVDSPDNNAQVVIPDNKSNYKPWEFSIDTHGNVATDVERAKKTSQFDQDWDNGMGDVITYFEDQGISAEQLSALSQEEFEDLIKKHLKMDRAKMNEDADAYFEIHGLEEEYDSLDESKNAGPVTLARDVLADKLKIKDAKEKIGRKYVIGRFDILKMMTKHGYTFDFNKNIWRTKQDKTSGSEHNFVGEYTPPKQPEPKVTPAVQQTTVNTKDDSTNDDDSIESVNDPDPNPEKPSKVDAIDNNPLNDLTVRSAIKEMQARFILGLAHAYYDYTIFIKDEKDEKLIYPKVESDKVLKTIESLSYTWDSLKSLWLTSEMTLPQAVFQKEESAKSVIARSILAAEGKYNKIKVKSSDNTPSASIHQVYRQMGHAGFEYKNEKWEWVPKDEREQLNEATTPVAPSKTEGYEPVEIDNIEEMHGRYLATVLWWAYVAQTWDPANQPKNRPLYTSSSNVTKQNRNICENQLQQTLVNPHPANAQAQSIINANKPAPSQNPNKPNKPHTTLPQAYSVDELKEMPYLPKDNEIVDAIPYAITKSDGQGTFIEFKQIQKVLVSAGYKINDNALWSHPTKNISWGETEEQLMGRFYLASIEKSGKYLETNFATGITPVIGFNKIKQKLNSNKIYYVGGDKGTGGQWMKVPDGAIDKSGTLMSQEMLKKKQNEEKFLEKYADRTYTEMNGNTQKQYKELSRKYNILKIYKVEFVKWENMKDKDKQLYIDRYMKNFKFVYDLEKGTKGWERRDDANNFFKRHITNIKDKLTPKKGGNLRQILSYAGKTAAAGAVGISSLYKGLSKIANSY